MRRKREIRFVIHEIRRFIGREHSTSEYDRFLYNNAYNIAGTMCKLEGEFHSQLSRAEIDLVYAYVLEKIFIKASEPGAHRFDLALAPFMATRGVIAYYKRFRKFKEAHRDVITSAMHEVRTEFWRTHKKQVSVRQKFHEYLHKYYIHSLETNAHRANIILFAKHSTLRYLTDQFAKTQLGPLTEDIRT
ncbi:Uncharacterised protein [uncultured archaeon]|nr:Uncharacterised protein [uncultured archaeon]